MTVHNSLWTHWWQNLGAPRVVVHILYLTLNVTYILVNNCPVHTVLSTSSSGQAYLSLSLTPSLCPVSFFVGSLCFLFLCFSCVSPSYLTFSLCAFSKYHIKLIEPRLDHEITVPMFAHFQLEKKNIHFKNGASYSNIQHRIKISTHTSELYFSKKIDSYPTKPMLVCRILSEVALPYLWPMFKFKSRSNVRQSHCFL